MCAERGTARLLTRIFFKKPCRFQTTLCRVYALCVKGHPLLRANRFRLISCLARLTFSKTQRTCKDKKLSSNWQKAKIDLSEEVRLIKEMIVEARPAAPPQTTATAPAASSERGARKKEAVPPRETAAGEDYLPQWAKDGKFSRNGQTVDLKSSGGSKKDAVVRCEAA
jgi:hypothetical protein